MVEQVILKHQGAIVGQYGDYRLMDCAECGFVHVDPLPTDEALEAVYDEQFYGTDKPQYLEKMEQEIEYWRESVFRFRFDVFERLLPDEPAPRKVLDIGCSGGFFLKYGQDRGWDSLGIEPSRQAATYAREVQGVHVIQDYFQKCVSADWTGSFDVVHLRNVLEHLPNPIELCQKSHEVLKPNGILCLEVPNDFNPLQTLAHQHLEAPQYWVSIPHHLNYFNRDSLQRLLGRLGFEVVHAEATFPIEFFLLMGENYVGNNPVGLQCHTRRMQLEQALSRMPETRELRNRLYQFFAEQGIGRTLVLFARKVPVSQA